MPGLYPLASAPLAADPNAVAGPFSSNALAIIQLVGSTAEGIFGFKMIQNFRIVSGDTHTLLVRVKDANGDPVDIGGATIKWRCARSFGRAAAISKQTGGSGITIIDGANAVFAVAIDPDDTEDLAGSFYHEAEIRFLPDSSVSTVVHGTLTIERDLIEAT